MSDVKTYSVREEIAHSAIHGLGIVLSIAGLIALVLTARRTGDTRDLVASAVYGVTLVLLYLTSTLYHSIPHPPAKRILRILDHSAIYLLIAGTYTPFILIKMQTPWGFGLLAVVWTMAAIGIAIKLFFPRFLDGLSTALYLVQGWAVIAAWEPLMSALPGVALTLLTIGGVLYTVGVVFHLWERLPYQNAIWHGFVLLGASCHYSAVLSLVLA